MEEKTDKQLYKEFLLGNKNSFEEIVIRYKDTIIYFIQRYVKSMDIAEDLAQDVFVYILVNKRSYKFEYSLKTYLYTIAKSKALNYIKREKKIVKLDEMQCEDLDELEEKVFKNERADNLKKCIKRLRIEYQNAIYLADIEELSYKEIGHILRKTESNVKVLIHRARKNLEKLIKEEEYKYEN
ncbi:MAG: RNA polymerase sigma factor [Clostridia bacterium]|nr:RNA polymerase sigma factor [Clostridia bacterium]